MAICKAYDRCESMRIRYTQDENGDILQYIVDKDPEIEFFDFREWNEDDIRAKFEEWTRATPEFYHSQMSSAVMVVLPNGWRSLPSGRLHNNGCTIFIRVIQRHCRYLF